MVGSTTLAVKVFSDKPSKAYAKQNPSIEINAIFLNRKKLHPKILQITQNGALSILYALAAKKMSSEADPELLVENEAEDGVDSCLSKGHPDRGGQVDLRDGAGLDEDAQVTGHNVRRPQEQEEEGDHVEHLTDPFLRFELLQDQQPLDLAMGGILPDAHQGRRGGPPTKASCPVGSCLSSGPRPMESPVLADGWHQLGRFHLAVAVNEEEKLDVHQVGGGNNSGQHEHEAQRVVGLDVAMLKDALLLLPDELVGAHVEDRREGHGHGEGPDHAHHRQAGPASHALGVEAVVGNGHVARHTHTEKEEGGVEAEEHGQECQDLAAEHPVGPGAGPAVHREHDEGKAGHGAQPVGQAEVQEQVVRGAVQLPVLQDEPSEEHVPRQADAEDQAQRGELEAGGAEEATGAAGVGAAAAAAAAASSQLAGVRHLARLPVAHLAPKLRRTHWSEEEEGGGAGFSRLQRLPPPPRSSAGLRHMVLSPRRQAGAATTSPAVAAAAAARDHFASSGAIARSPRSSPRAGEPGPLRWRPRVPSALAFPGTGGSGSLLLPQQRWRSGELRRGRGVRRAPPFRHAARGCPPAPDPTPRRLRRRRRQGAALEL